MAGRRPRRRTPRTSASDASGWASGWYPPPSRPRPADGIRARSRRGAIGETWWSQRFIELLESFDLGTRLDRGRRYARAGQVLDLDVRAGAVTSLVQGSRAQPYRVRIETLVLSSKDWARVEEVLASRAVFLAKLLAGEMPRDIEQAFTDTRLTLFPASSRDLSTDCSCPDWANPCKHIAATYYLLAEAFDLDPFLIFRWRGRDRDELLAHLVASPGAVVGGANTPELWSVPDLMLPALADSIDHFWDAADEPDRILPPAQPAIVADGILRGLEPGAIDVAGRPLATVISSAYPAIIAAAEGLRRRSGST